MGESLDLYSKPDFQKRLAKRSESWLDANRLLTRPTVVYDSGADEFWTALENSPSSSDLVRHIKHSLLIPINADALSQVSLNHVKLHQILSTVGIATIPTYTQLGERTGWIGQYQLARQIPGVFVRKVSSEGGRSFAHGGEGVSIVRVEDIKTSEYRPRDDQSFLQPFVVPPDGFIRDIRTFLVDGKPVAGRIRQARKKLTAENLSGAVLPTPDQYHTAKHLGINVPFSDDLKSLTFPLAEQIAGVLSLLAQKSKLPYAPVSRLGFGSIDFLLDANGRPLPVDFDLAPHITSYNEVDRTVAEKLAARLNYLSRIGGIAREIMVIGSSVSDFEHQVVKILKDMNAPVYFKTALFETVMRE